MENIVNEIHFENENGFLETTGVNFTLFLGFEEIQAMALLAKKPNKVFTANQYCLKISVLKAIEEHEENYFKIESEEVYFEEHEEEFEHTTVFLPFSLLPKMLENSKNLQSIAEWYGEGYEFLIQ
jgi:hypothetical protein